MASPTVITIDMGPLIKKIKGRVDLFILEFVQDIAQQVVEATPVDTGFLRSSWYMAINEVPNDIRKRPAGLVGRRSRFRSAGGKKGVFEQAFQNILSSSTEDQLNLKLLNANVGDKLYILNNAEYAGCVEFGTPTMDARAMVRKTYANAEATATAAANRIMKRIK